MKGVPSEEELTAYRSWKENQQTEQQQQARREKEFNKSQSDLAAAQEELEALKREKYVLGKGLSGDEAEFVAFKAAKLMDDKTTFENSVFNPGKLLLTDCTRCIQGSISSGAQ